MFNRLRKDIAKNVADSSEYRTTIKPKDGNVHVMMVDSFAGLGEGSTIQIEEKYSNQINEFLDTLQNKGYEIVDVKFNSVPIQRMTSNMKYQTLILYK